MLILCLFVFVRAIRFSTAEQFFLIATRCSHGHRPLIFFITLLFTVLVVSEIVMAITLYIYMDMCILKRICL